MTYEMPQMEGSLFYATKHIARLDAVMMLNRINGIWARETGERVEYGIMPMAFGSDGLGPNFAGHDVLDQATAALTAADAPVADPA